MAARCVVGGFEADSSALPLTPSHGELFSVSEWSLPDKKRRDLAALASCGNALRTQGCMLAHVANWMADFHVFLDMGSALGKWNHMVEVNAF